MAAALVGTVGAVTQGASGAAVTPVWQGNEPRTAGNKLICWVGVTGTATLPTTPAGWNIAKQIAGTSCSATIYYRDATGADAAPTIALIASGVIAASLGEYSGLVLGAPEQSGSAATAVSPIVATAGGADGQIGNLMVTNLAAFFSQARSPTLTNTYTNATAVARDNAGTSIANHYSQAYGGPTTANSLADKDSFALGASTSLTGMALVLASFKPMLDVNVSDAVGTSESAATQTLVDNTNGISDAVGVADGPPNATLVHNTNGVSDAVGHSESVTVALMPPDQLVAVQDIVLLKRENFVPNPSFEYDTLAGAPALWSTATDGTFITTGATATVVSDTNTVDSSGTKVVELTGNGVSAKEGMAITITPPAGFQAGHNYTFRLAARVVSGDGSIRLVLSDGSSDGTTITTSWQHDSFTWNAGSDTASATLYITNPNAAAYVWRIDAVVVYETNGDTRYFDGDTTGGVWAGTAGQSTSVTYGDVPRETLVFNAAARDIVAATRENWCPNPSAEYDTLGSAPALWSTATDAFHITTGATATVVSDSNTVDASGTKAIELVGDGVSTREGMAILITPPGGFKAGRPYVVQMAIRYISGDGHISLGLGGSTLGTSISGSGAWVHHSLFSSGMFSADVASATLYIVNDNALAYTWRIDAVLVREQTSTDISLGVVGDGAATYVDGDTAGGVWAGTAGQSTSLAYGDAPLEMLESNRNVSDAVGVAESTPLLPLLVALPSVSDAVGVAESTGETKVFNAAVRDIATVTRDNWVPNPSFEYDTLAGAPALWSTATDGSNLTAGATATVVSDTNTADASGTQAVELVGDGLSTKEGMAITVTPPGGFKAGRLYTVQAAVKVISGSGRVHLALVPGPGSNDTTIFVSTWRHVMLVAQPVADAASATLYISNPFAAAYVWHIDAVLVREETSDDDRAFQAFDGSGGIYGDGDSGVWAGTPGQSTSFGYGDVVAILLGAVGGALTITTSDAAAAAESIGRLLEALANISDAASVAESTGQTLVHNPSVSDAAAVAENALATLVHNALTSDSVSVAESTIELLLALVTTSEAVSATESTLELLLGFIAASDSIGAGESTNETLVHNPIVSDSVTVSESLAALLVALAAVSDAVSAAESTNETLASNPIVSDAVSVAENRAQTLVHNASTSDPVTISESLVELLLSFASVSDAVAVAESIGQTQAANAAVTDTVATSEALTELLVSFIAASETIGGGAGAIAVDASTPAMVSGGGGGSTATSPSFSPPGGSLLLICFANEQGNTSITSITDSLGASLPYSRQKRNSSAAPNAAEIWIAQVPSTAPGSMTVTVHSSGSVSFGSLAVIVLTGAADASVQSTSATASGGSGAALPSASYTATADGSIGFAVIVNSNDNTGPTIPAGQTDVFNGHTDFHNGTIGSSWVQATTTGASAGATVTVNDTAPSTNFLEALVEIAPSNVGSITESTKETLISPVAASDSVGVAESTKELLEALAAVSDAAAAAEFTNETLVDNAAVSEAITAAEAVSELLQSFVVTTDSVSVTESNIAAVQGLLAVIETVGVSESTQELLASFAATSDSVNTAESTNETLVDNTAVSDAVSLAEAVAETLVHNAAVSDSTTVDESVLELLLSFIAASESISATEAANVLLVLLGVLTASVSDSVTVSESTDELLGILIAALDSPIVSESTLELLVSFVAATDAAAASEATNETLVHNASVSDPVTATELAASLLVSLISQSESVTASENLAELLIAFIASSESVSVSDDDFVVLSVLGAIVLAIQENVGVDEAASAALLALITVSDAPTLSESAQAALSVALAVTDATTVAEALILRPESFVAVLDALTASDSVAASLANTIAALEAVAVTESSSSSLSIAALVAEGINVLDAASALLVSLVATSDGAAVGDAIALTLASTIAISEALTVQDAPSIDALLLTVAVAQAITVEDDLLISLLAVLVAGILTSTTSAAMLTSESAEAVMLTSTQQRAATLDTKLS